MNKFTKVLLGFSMLIWLTACNQQRQVTKKSQSNFATNIGEQQIFVESYIVKYGNISSEKVQSRLFVTLDALKKTYQLALQDDPDLRVKGTLTYAFRLEPNGMIGMLLEKEVDFEDEQEALSNQFSIDIMRNQKGFSSFNDISVLEATFKFK